MRRSEAVLDIVRGLRLSSPRILEVGCATGWLCQKLCRFGSVTGIDLGDDMIARARANVPDARFLAGDFLEMDLDPEPPYDLAVSVEVIAHVRAPQAFCDRIASLLTDGGYLVLTAQNRSVWARSGRLTEPPEIIQDLLTMRELKALLRPHFEVLRARTIIPFGRGGYLRIVNSVKLNRLLRAILGTQRVRRLKERLGFGNTLVVLARKRA